ncbi:MAG: hypothetical protein VYB54_04740 [Pseudomonadota bacterium]|nr:hypothetical protein [Pseudomonadota bacterium]
MGVTYTIPVPPPANACWRNAGFGKDTKRGGRIRTARYQTWARAAANELLAQRARQFPGLCSVALYVPCARVNADIDNRVKPALDILVTAGVLAGDDSRHVKRVSAEWVGKDQPCTIVLEAV